MYINIFISSYGQYGEVGQTVLSRRLLESVNDREICKYVYQQSGYHYKFSLGCD